MTKQELLERKERPMSDYASECLERVDLDDVLDTEEVDDLIYSAIDDEMIYYDDIFNCVKDLNGNDLSRFINLGYTDMGAIANVLVAEDIFECEMC